MKFEVIIYTIGIMTGMLLFMWGLHDKDIILCLTGIFCYIVAAHAGIMQYIQIKTSRGEDNGEDQSED